MRFLTFTGGFVLIFLPGVFIRFLNHGIIKFFICNFTPKNINVAAFML